MSKKEKIVSVRLTADQNKEVEEISRKEDRTISQVLRTLVREALENRKSNNRSYINDKP